MRIVGNKIIVFLEEIFPDKEQCNPKELDRVLTFTQTHQSYQQFTHLIFHLSKVFPLKELKDLHQLAWKSGMMKSLLSNIKLSKTNEELAKHIKNLYGILEENSKIKKLFDLFEKMLNHKLSIKAVYENLQTNNFELSEILPGMSDIAEQYLKIFSLYLKFIESLYPSLSFLKDTPFIKFKLNPILTNCYTICEKEMLSLEEISEKLAGKETAKSIDTLILNGFSSLSNKDSQQEILNLLFITLRHNRHITHLQFNNSFVDNQIISYTLDSLQNTEVEELIFHKSILNPFYAKGETAFSSLKKVPTLVALKFYHCSTPPATHIKEIADVLENNGALSSLHIEENTEGINCSYCKANDEDFDNDRNDEIELINFHETSPNQASNKEPFCNTEKDIPATINYLLNGLAEKNPSFELSLSRNAMTMQNVASLYLALKQAANLKKLDLSHNDLGDEAVIELATNSIYLQELNLSGNNISDQGCIAIAHLLEDHTNNLKILNLSDNNITEKGARILADALRYNTTLKTLDLSYNQIGSSAVDIIQNSKLQHLFVQGNALFFDDIMKIIELLTNNHFLKSIGLNLSDGNIENATDYEKLHKALITNHTLTGLELIIPEDSDAAYEETIAEIITTSISLTHLIISMDFSVSILDCIAKALAKNYTLKSLTWVIDATTVENYNDNEIYKILETLKQNTSLMAFDISWSPMNKFPDEYRHVVNNLVRRNQKIEALVTTAPVTSLQTQQATLLKFGHSETHFWKYPKPKPPLSVNYELVKDNIKCFYCFYMQRTETWLEKLAQRSQAQDNSAEILFPLSRIFALNSSVNKTVEKDTEILDNYIKIDPSLATFIFTECLILFQKTQKESQENLTALQIECLILSQKIQEGSQANLSALQKDIDFTQKLLDKSLAIINNKKFPEPNENITNEFISQLQSKH